MVLDRIQLSVTVQLYARPRGDPASDRATRPQPIRRVYSRVTAFLVVCNPSSRLRPTPWRPGVRPSYVSERGTTVRTGVFRDSTLPFQLVASPGWDLDWVFVPVERGFRHDGPSSDDATWRLGLTT
eukprot:3226070-Prymnesium_polylepis.1